MIRMYIRTTHKKAQDEVWVCFENFSIDDKVNSYNKNNHFQTKIMINNLKKVY